LNNHQNIIRQGAPFWLRLPNKAGSHILFKIFWTKRRRKILRISMKSFIDILPVFRAQNSALLRLYVIYLWILSNNLSSPLPEIVVFICCPFRNSKGLMEWIIRFTSLRISIFGQDMNWHCVKNKKDKQRYYSKIYSNIYSYYSKKDICLDLH
jgi:hypothetical protein